MYIDINGRTFEVKDEGNVWRLTHKTRELTVQYKVPKNAAPSMDALQTVFSEQKGAE